MDLTAILYNNGVVVGFAQNVTVKDGEVQLSNFIFGGDSIVVTSVGLQIDIRGGGASIERLDILKLRDFKP